MSTLTTSCGTSLPSKLPTVSVADTCPDSLHLTLLNVSPEEAIDIPSPRDDRAAFQFDPRAQVFVPQQPLLNSQSEFVQDLFVEWQMHAFAWEDETPSCVVLTWMVDHTWDQPHCFHPRPVRLFDDFVSWEGQLTHAWHDFIDDNQPREFHIVLPKPLAVDNSTSQFMSSSFSRPMKHGLPA